MKSIPYDNIDQLPIPEKFKKKIKDDLISKGYKILSHEELIERLSENDAFLTGKSGKEVTLDWGQIWEVHDETCIIPFPHDKDGKRSYWAVKLLDGDAYECFEKNKDMHTYLAPNLKTYLDAGGKIK